MPSRTDLFVQCAILTVMSSDGKMISSFARRDKTNIVTAPLNQRTFGSLDEQASKSTVARLFSKVSDSEIGK